MMPWKPQSGHSLAGSHSWQERIALVRKAASLMDERIFEMGVIVGMEVGKRPHGSPW